MDWTVTHGPEGPRIVFTLSPFEAACIHEDLRPTLNTHHAYDAFDSELFAALREVRGATYYKGNL